MEPETGVGRDVTVHLRLSLSSPDLVAVSHPESDAPPRLGSDARDTLGSGPTFTEALPGTRSQAVANEASSNTHQRRGRGVVLGTPIQRAPVRVSGPWNPTHTLLSVKGPSFLQDITGSRLSVGHYSPHLYSRLASTLMTYSSGSGLKSKVSTLLTPGFSLLGAVTRYQ